MALLMNGTVLLALGFTSRTKIFSSLIANWMLINPMIFNLIEITLVNLFISSIIDLGIVWGGIEQAESPECTPASSICSKIPAIKTSLPSEIASTSISFASTKNWSINIALPFSIKFELK